MLINTVLKYDKGMESYIFCLFYLLTSVIYDLPEIAKTTTKEFVFLTFHGYTVDSSNV